MTSKFNKRIGTIEERVNPRVKVLIVIVSENDATCIAAKERVMKERGIATLSDDCVVYTLNFHSKPQS